MRQAKADGPVPVMQHVRLVGPARTQLYASGLYAKLLEPLGAEPAATGDMFARAKAIGSQGRLKPHAWPMTWLLELLYEYKMLSRPDVIQALTMRRYTQATIDAQVARLFRCPLAISHDRFWVKARYL